MTDNGSQPHMEPDDGDPTTSDRRDFMRKLAYATPVLTSYLLQDTAYAGGDDDQIDWRRRRRTSPKPPIRIDDTKKVKEDDKERAIPPPPTDAK